VDQGAAAHIELSARAQRDLRRSGKGVARRLEETLGVHPLPRNADVVPLRGRSPWLRLRPGSYRVLFRPLTRRELDALGVDAEAGFPVARVVDRRELERAVAALR